MKRVSFCLSRHPCLRYESDDNLEAIQARTYKNLVELHATELSVLRTSLLYVKDIAIECTAAAYVKENDKTLTVIKRILETPS